jgi:hypothetical protein
MSDRAPYRQIIKPSPANRQMVKREFDTGDIIRVIMYADKRSGEFVAAESVDHLRGPDDYHTLENIFWFVKKNVQYQADPAGQEDVRSPGYLFDSGQGDCKSLSIAIGALCRAAGIPYSYRFVRQAGRPNFHHVYVVACTPDGSARGEVILDAVHRGYNSEFNYAKKLDLKPGSLVPAGIAGNTGISAFTLILLFGIWFAFSKKVK